MLINTVVQQGWSDGAFWVYHYLTFYSSLRPQDSLIMKKRKNTEFYLLRKKSLSEADENIETLKNNFDDYGENL